MGSTGDLVERIYDTVLEPEAWTSALEAIVDAVHANHADIIVQRRADRAIHFAAAAHVAPWHLAAMQSAVASGAADPWLQMLPPSVVVPSTALVPQSVLARTDLFNELVVPMGGYYAAAAQTFASPVAAGYFAVCRPKRSGDFDDPDVALLQLLLPHLGAAMRMRSRVAVVEARSRLAYEALDRVEIGVILTDAAGTPHFVNRAAEVVIRQNDGLSIGRSGLAAATSAHTGRLRRLIAAAGDGEALARHGELRLCLPRPSLRRPLVVRVLPAGRAAEPLATRALPSVALFVHDPERHVAIDRATVAASFGLTPREADVAAMLAQGRGPAEVADALGLSLGTVRTHLKQVYAKTQTRRQGELVALILNLRL